MSTAVREGTAHEDGGETGETNWVMDFTRAEARR
jgi:hypothetical protein